MKSITSMKPASPQEFFGKDKMYGTTKVGPRGQVVIPVEARNDLGLKPGDQLLVMSKFGKVLGLMKADHIVEDLVGMLMANIDDAPARKQLQALADKFIKNR
jgi:AbrB family looped-hinge helix DNA binding protein